MAVFSIAYCVGCGKWDAVCRRNSSADSHTEKQNVVQWDAGRGILDNMGKKKQRVPGAGKQIAPGWGLSASSTEQL